jgi:hypothetical protein
VVARGGCVERVNYFLCGTRHSKSDGQVVVSVREAFS